MRIGVFYRYQELDVPMSGVVSEVDERCRIACISWWSRLIRTPIDRCLLVYHLLTCSVNYLNSEQCWKLNFDFHIMWNVVDVS